MIERGLTAARRAFYNADGPWRRRGIFEAIGSRRYSHPALQGIDLALERLLDFDGGTFLEAGAHDGYTQSNTYYLERYRGWSGILVEAIPELHAKATSRRPRSDVVHAALVGPEYAEPTIPVTFGDLMSQVGTDPTHAAGGLANAGRSGYTVAAPARTLTQILEGAGISHLDLLVLDIEGHELQALRGLDMERFAVDHLVVEMLDMQRQRPAFDELLKDRFEFAGELSALDAHYMRRRR